jgi:hypothetical protein
MSDIAAEAIDRYLNEVCWAMGGSLTQQQAARDELRPHIIDAVRERELAGAAPTDALRYALDRMGNPAALGRELRASRASGALNRPLIQPEGAIVLVAHRERHLPHPGMVAALALSTAAAVAVALAYAWPA